MIATSTTHIQDLRASLENAFAQQADCQAQVNHQQSLFTQLQNERATFEQKQAEREQAQAAFSPQVQEASAMLAQAQDYAKAASGSIKNTALDEVLAAQELHNEMRSQLQVLVKKHQAEQGVDQPFIDELDAQIRSAKLALSQLASQQEALAGTRVRLHAELGQAIYSHYSAILKPSREKQVQLETEIAQIGDIYAQLRAEAFGYLSEWPELKRQLQAENDITDNSELNALTQFAAFCEQLAEHPIQDMATVTVFEIDSYNLAAYEGGSNSMLFAERARMARARIAELQYAKK